MLLTHNEVVISTKRKRSYTGIVTVSTCIQLELHNTATIVLSLTQSHDR